MIKNRHLFVLLLLIAFISGSCKKYPDGPEFSLLPKNFRLEENWKTNKVYENKIDVTTVVLAKVTHESRNINRHGGFTYELDEGGSSLSYSGSWSFSSDKTVIYFTYVFGSNVNTDTYLILRLKEDDLWLQNITPSGDVMEYHLIPN
jgi:hypothetical protein